jgi:stage IV sporulation protein B
MLFKQKKLNVLCLLLALFIIPIQVFAYSDYVIAGGQNIGIELDSAGIIIVGTYEVNGKNLASDAKLQVGDKIISVNNQEVDSIESMLDVINNSNMDEEIQIGYLRGSKEYTTNLTLEMESDVYKTGLYVKDSITGVGTLTFIDPNTKIFGALGHEIVESTTGQKLEIKDGKIYSSTVTSINPSTNGDPGEKNAKYNTDEVYGTITENSSCGIFGEYTEDISSDNLYQVASYDEIELGSASILTVINDNDVEEFSINILKVSNDNQDAKNILFEITDNELLSVAGGIVQGMSGSPIIQNNKIIGAVTHVVVDDPTKGYGIFITNMLEEAEN